MTTPQQPGIGPPGYGPPGYGAPGYGAPGYPPPFGYRAPTNTMAILSLVFAFVFAPVGLGLGIAARKQIARTGEEGSGLAMAGIVVGGIFTGIWVLIVVGYVILFAALAHNGFGP
ncbi:MAG TPA: DUF4190 domain-containing protein [Acidimicrobiales bacterium]|nr:DUF4190 domain-containing protein [Acidimicrobiales bacterium]